MTNILLSRRINGASSDVLKAVVKDNEEGILVFQTSIYIYRQTSSYLLFVHNNSVKVILQL